MSDTAGIPAAMPRAATAAGEERQPAAPFAGPVTMSYRVDAVLLYETMVASGRAMMKKPEPGGGRTAWRAIGIWLAILVGIAAFIDAVAATGARTEILYAMLGLVLGFAFYTVFLNRSYRRLARLMAANPVYAGILTTTVDAGGIEIRSACTLNRYGWDAVEGVLPLKAALALLVPSQLVPLPDSALPQGVTRDELRARIDGWRRQARIPGGAG